MVQDTLEDRIRSMDDDSVLLDTLITATGINYKSNFAFIRKCELRLFTYWTGGIS